MNYRLLALAVVIIGGISLGFVWWNSFYQPQGAQLVIDEVEWGLQGDYTTMSIPVRNLGEYPVTITSISVREDALGSTEYTDNDPLGVTSGSNDIAGGGGDTFEWNAGSGSAPFNFLQSGKTYVIKVTTGTGFVEKTVTAPAEMW